MARPHTFAAAERLTLPPPLDRRAAVARAVVWLEASWGLLRLGLLATVLFAALGLLGVWQALPGLVRWAALVGLAGFWLRIGWRLVRTVGWPSQSRALALLEARARLARGQLRLLMDRPADPETPYSAWLWHHARTDALAAARRTRLPWPRLDCLTGDRFGLGPLAVLLLALGWLVAADQRAMRLDASFSPYWSSLAGIAIDITVTPPAYTGRGPTVHRLAGGTRTELALPAGSRLTLTVNGLDARPGTVRLIGPDGEAEAVLTARGDSLTAMVLPDRDGSYRIKSGWRTIAALGVRRTPDTAPRVALLEPPVITATGALRLRYRIADDFGATALAVDVGRDRETRRLPVPSTPGGNGDGTLFLDLTPDPWAGLNVQLRLVARDAAGNSGRSAAHNLALPERQFSRPFAQHIIAVRRDLLRRPATRAVAAGRLAFLSSERGQFADDFTVYAGLRAARWRLIYDKDDPRGWSVARLLWDVAVDVEDGGQARSLDDLRRQLDDIAGRLEGASDSEMAAMMDALTGALARHLGQLAAGSPTPDAAGASGGQVIDASALGDMLADLRERLAAGDTAGARQSLASLRGLIEALRAGGGGTTSGAALRRAAEDARALESRQQTLFGDTVTGGLEGPSALRRLAARQRALGEAVAALEARSRQTGSRAAESLARARARMSDAATALGDGRAPSAMTAQAQALRALGQATADLETEARQGRGSAAAGMTDPLGRMSGGTLGSEFRLPDARERRLVDSIRKTLEDKVADPRVPEAERAYYMRLLKQF